MNHSASVPNVTVPSSPGRSASTSSVPVHVPTMTTTTMMMEMTTGTTMTFCNHLDVGDGWQQHPSPPACLLMIVVDE
jgi:hypothetical protein